MQSLIIKARKAGIEKLWVSVILENQENVLLLERPPGFGEGGRFELPTSEVGPGETLQQALQRTVMETTRLGLNEVGRHLKDLDFESEGKKNRKFIFIATPLEPTQIQTQRHAAHAWVAPEDSSSYPITDELREILDLYAKWKRGG